MYDGMKCPNCGAKTIVKDTRKSPYGRRVNRRRDCTKCDFRGFTRETWNVDYNANMEKSVLDIVKK